MNNLTARQEKLLASMLTEPTFQAAYREAGTSKATALRYRDSPEFNRAYHEAKRQAMRQVTTELQRRSLEAVAVLTDMMSIHPVHAFKVPEPYLTLHIKALNWTT